MVCVQRFFVLLSSVGMVYAAHDNELPRTHPCLAYAYTHRIPLHNLGYDQARIESVEEKGSACGVASGLFSCLTIAGILWTTHHYGLIYLGSNIVLSSCLCVKCRSCYLQSEVRIAQRAVRQEPAVAPVVQTMPAGPVQH